MVVLGGGPVGSELSQAWSSLGTKVTLVEGGEHLLGRDEPFAGAEVEDSLRERFGVDVRTGSLAARIAPGGAGVEVELKDGSEVEGEELLVAIGRVPHTAELGLDAAGVETGEHGFLETDDRMQVRGTDWLYAIGDVNGRALFTHVGKYQAWIAAENLLGRPVEAAAEALGSPRVTFTDPQVAAVGKTLQQALDAGIDARAVDVPTDGTPGASFQGKGTGGTSRLVVDQAKETIVGATFTGFETADFLHAATVAIVAEVPLPRLRHAVAAYPDAQRGLAEAGREVRSRRVRAVNGRAALEAGEHLGREAVDAVEVVDRLEATDPLAVGEQTGRLGDREVVGPQLLEGDRVEVDLRTPGGRGRRRLRGRGERRRRLGGRRLRRHRRSGIGTRRHRLGRRRCRRWRRRTPARGPAAVRAGSAAAEVGTGSGPGAAATGGGRGLRRRGLGTAPRRRPPVAGASPWTERTTACSASSARRSASRARSSASATLRCISARRCLTSVFLGFQRLQALRLGGALFGGFGPLVDLAQALLGLGDFALAGAARLFQDLLGGAQVGAAERACCLLLEPLGLGHPAVGLGADPLLLEAHLLDLLAHPLFGRDRVVLGRGRRVRALPTGGGTAGSDAICGGGGGGTGRGAGRGGTGSGWAAGGVAPAVWARAWASSRSAAARAAARRCSASAASRFCLPPPYLIPKKVFCLAGGARPRPRRSSGGSAHGGGSPRRQDRWSRRAAAGGL